MEWTLYIGLLSKYIVSILNRLYVNNNIVFDDVKETSTVASDEYLEQTNKYKISAEQILRIIIIQIQFSKKK